MVRSQLRVLTGSHPRCLNLVLFPGKRCLRRLSSASAGASEINPDNTLSPKDRKRLLRILPEEILGFPQPNDAVKRKAPSSLDALPLVEGIADVERAMAGWNKSTQFGSVITTARRLATRPEFKPTATVYAELMHATLKACAPKSGASQVFSLYQDLRNHAVVPTSEVMENLFCVCFYSKMMS